MKSLYIAPESKVMEMKAEGVLCNSFVSTPDNSSTPQKQSIEIWNTQTVEW